MRFYTVALFFFIIACSSLPLKRSPAGGDDIHIVATTDVHGYLLAQKATDGSSFGGIDTLSGYLQVAKQADPETLVVDSGDLYQGTILSNTNEGRPVITWMNYAGYSATVVGNHDFDFGPGGGHSHVMVAGEDPLGVLKARIKQSKFKWLSANICSIDEDAGKCADVKTFAPASFVEPWKMFSAHGVKVAIIGLTTPSTPNTTFPANVERLRFLPLTETLARYIPVMRNAGAETIAVIVHEGSTCPNQQCNFQDPLFKMIDDLPAGYAQSISAVMAGHTHNQINLEHGGVRFMINGSYSHSFGYVTLARGTDGRFTASAVDSVSILPGKTFLGQTVQTDPKAIDIIGDDAKRAEAKSAEIVGEVASPLTYVFNKGESTLGDFVSDAIRQCLDPNCDPSKALDIAFENGTGLRIKLIPKGNVTYGQIFELMPFDNALAVVSMTGRQVRDLVVSWFNYNHGNMNDTSGIHLEFIPTQLPQGAAQLPQRKMTNARGETQTLADPIKTFKLSDGSLLDEDKVYRVGMADYLAEGGSGSAFVMRGLKPDIHEDRSLRDMVLDYLAAHKGTPLDYGVLGGHRLVPQPAN